MPKHKMIMHNLIKNSISAYFAAVEIHNKPNIEYRYETVTLLLINSWELALKAYVRKYIKDRSIFTKDTKERHTISIDKALSYVSDDINSKMPCSFEAVKKNIELIEKYRNDITHFYADSLEPYIFMLVAKSALNYVEFMKKYFDKDIMADEGLFIMPLGFKLPFKPEDFLSENVADYSGSQESKEFISSIVKVIRELDAEGVDDSIVLGFDIYFESIKKISNSDIVAAITSAEDAEVIFGKVQQAKFSDDPGAAVYSLSDDDFRKVWKYSYDDVLNWCKKNISGFKQGHLFNEIMREVKMDYKFAYNRRLDNNNPKSASKYFYTDKCFDYIKEQYESRLY